MKTALRIFWRDIRRILKNPVALIITLGVCIIPSLYAWFNILANWDPYKNTSDIQIAIVNQDEGATVGDMGHISAGDMVVEELHKNKQLGWRFVKRSAAMDGVRAGHYYAAIVIPKDFTSTLAGVIGGKTAKAHIKYYVNEKENAVAPKVTDTGASTIESQINNTFAGTVAGVISDKLGDAAGKALDGASGAGSSLQADIQTVRGSLDDLSGGIDDAGRSIDDARKTVASAKETIASLDGTTKGISQKLGTASTDLKGARADAADLRSRLGSSLTSGTLALTNMSTKANYDVGRLTGDVGWAQGRLDNAIARLEAALTETHSIEQKLEYSRDTIVGIKGLDGDSLTAQSEVTKSLDIEIQYLIGMSDQMKARLDALKALSDDVKSGAASVGNLSSAVNNSIQTSASALSDVQGDLSETTIPAVDGALDDFSQAASGVSSVVAGISPALQQVSATLDQLDQVLAQAKPALSSTRDSVSNAADTLSGLESDIAALQTTQAYKELTSVSGINPDVLKNYFTSPVELSEKAIYPVRNYGSGVTPFYTDLALWVGGFVLVAIYKREVDDESIGEFKPWQGYVGRALLFSLLGEVQAIICCVGDLALGIQCVNPVAFVVAGMVESFVYVNIVFSLSTAFKHIGMALGVILVILQIPGSSGTYPIEMMPGFFRALEPLLPFTYGNNAMREAIAGFYDGYYGTNIAVLLLAYMPIALIVGLGARRHLLNINALFDKRLRETDMMVSERYNMDEAHFKLTTIIKALTNSSEYRRTFEARAAHFELMYPVLVRRGFLALMVIPVALNVLMFVLPFKMVLMTLWILSMIFICTFLIVTEYFHYRVSQKTHLSDMSEDELYDLLGDKLKQEFFAFAPIETMLIEKDAATSAAGATETGRARHTGKIGARIGRLRTEFDQIRAERHGAAATPQATDTQAPSADDGQTPSGEKDGASAVDGGSTRLILNVTALTGTGERTTRISRGDDAADDAAGEQRSTDEADSRATGKIETEGAPTEGDARDQKGGDAK